MDREEMISFIVESELKIMEAFKKGHKPHNEDEFQPLRDLMEKYREELGYKRNYCHYSGLPSPSAYESTEDNEKI
jgi:hypothetical protein